MWGWWRALVLVLIVTSGLACGQASSRSRGVRPGERALDDGEGRPRALPASDAYEVLARTRVLFREHELATLRSRLHFYVVERGRRGVSLRARVFRLGEGAGAAEAFSDVEVALDRRGGIAHDPLSLCDDPDIDDLSPTRVVRHVLGSLAPWDGGAEGALSFAFSEVEMPVVFGYRTGESDLVARASSSTHLGSFAIAGWRIHADGEAHVRAEERLDVADALAVRARLWVEVLATVTDVRGRSMSGILEIESDVVARSASLEAVAPETCESGFSRDDVTRAIEARRGEIRACYERALVADPTLHGRLSVAMTVLPLGEVSAVRVTSDDLGSPATADCVCAVVASLRFVEGPVGEGLTFSFPFVFEPTDAPPAAER